MLCGVISAVLPAVPAMAAVKAYMTVKGVKQGSIKGDAAKGDAMPENIPVISVVRDTATGMSTGRRTQATITIVREVDAASPKFATALSTNETLSEVVITFEGGSGGAKTAQRIVLTNAVISSIRRSGENEQITFEFQAIEVTYANGGKTATDDWNAPN